MAGVEVKRKINAEIAECAENTEKNRKDSGLRAGATKKEVRNGREAGWINS
jgi:hypothetical protein